MHIQIKTQRNPHIEEEGGAGRTEMSILEINQNLRSQLEKVKQDFRDLTEKFLTSKATVYSLANQLQKYNCEEYKELIEFVLEEGVPFEEGELAEKMRSAARLGKYDPLIQAQAQELTHLRQKIQEGKGACYLFTQHARNTVKSFESLLRSTDIAYYQRQRFCELLTQGSQLAERLASQLTTEDHQDREGEDGQEPLAPSCPESNLLSFLPTHPHPSFSRGLQAEEESEVQEDSLDEMYLTHSSYQDSHQPPNTNAFACDGQEASSAVDVAGEYPQYKEKKAPTPRGLRNEALAASPRSPPLSRVIEIISVGRPPKRALQK
ncbi:Neuroblastoma breakpoint family member 6-like protein [Camelus dromedarius]|uniref:Neuroblastoma breakpoint family member 6-like protein n=1 Tax=Camelus dromedarius TaxID=9838 RepID=A0A5N4CP31_CAMDR|nr:Neuroblastoma breakpoint family member 6-like protein [Camelus dromedarius]